MDFLIRKLSALGLTLVVSLLATSTTFATATIVIQNVDDPNVGFNDPTPAAPVGGNNGTTVGQQRLNAFLFAANIWGATLTSGPKITIEASWPSLPCNATGGVLGAAGNSGSLWRDFPGAIPGTWYGNALANALSNKDREVETPEIIAQFNGKVGTPLCLEELHWYYGFDTNTDPGGINLVAVLLHEFAHGLGFQSFTNANSGSQFSGFPSIYDRFLFDRNTNKTWPEMTNQERAASSIGTNALVWNGAQVVSDAPSVLAFGNPELRVNAPTAIAGGYQVGTADFGPRLTAAGVTAGVVQALDADDSAGGATTDGCSALINGGAVAGKIALIDRGICPFVLKVKNAQNAGAVGVIIADNVAGSPPAGLFGSDPTITIPAVRITLADGIRIKGQLAPGVNATLRVDESVQAGADTSGRPRVFTPNPYQGGSSVSHWDSSAFPNQLMEPSLSGDLTHSVVPPQDLTLSMFRDIGWCAACPQPTPTPAPTPANDRFLNAQVITGTVGTVTGTNVGATKEAGEPNHDGRSGGTSIWYRWQAPVSGSTTFWTTGSTIDTLLAGYTGSGVNSLTLVASNDDFDNTLQSSVTFNALAGVVYYFAVDGFGGATGNITLKWNLPPANNNFANAQTISGCVGSVNGTNRGANKEPREPNHWDEGGASVWYQWQAPSDGSMIISTAGSDFDTTLAVYTGNSVNALTLVVRNPDVSSQDFTSSVIFNARAGTIYRIAVDGYAAKTGNIVLNWTGGGTCVITPIVVDTVINGNLATTDCRSLLRNFYPAFADHYTFQGTAGQRISILLNSATLDTYLYLLKPDGTVAASNDDGGENNNARIPADTGFFSLPVSGTYTIEATSHFGEKTGAYVLTVAPASTVQFSAAAYTSGEGVGSATTMIAVTRNGDLSTASSVNVVTSDLAGAQNCNVSTGIASSRCDYQSRVSTVTFAAGETSKSVSLFIVDDSYAEGSETFTLCLSNPFGSSLGAQSTANVTITDNDLTNGVNPVDAASFFVRQHYLDFLNREPDSSGLNFWTDQIASCGNNQQCIDLKRINVSAAFYLSIEFQETGYLVERLYKVAYGTATGTSTLGGSHQLSVPVVRLNEFLPDTQQIGQGVIVGQSGWEQVIENNKRAFIAGFVQRARFTLAYPASVTPTNFVDALNTNAENSLSQQERTQLITQLTSGSKTRSDVLRAVAEDPDLVRTESNRAFVLMQFFGYLRRNPNDPQDTDYTGYDFWLMKLNQFNGNFVNAEMVKAFISSTEYRQRFGP